MTSMQVWTEALRTAAGGWRDQQGAIRDARTELTSAEGSVGALGPRVSGAAAAFLQTWVADLDSQKTSAERHADSLEGAAASYDATDAAAAAELASLLSWDQRTLRPDP